MRPSSPGSWSASAPDAAEAGGATSARGTDQRLSMLQPRDERGGWTHSATVPGHSTTKADTVTLRSVALIPVVLALVAACAGTASPLPTSPGAGAPSPAAPSAAPTSAPSATPGSPASPTPATTPDASLKPAPSDEPAPSFSASEKTLLEALRMDARIDCAPRRADLPGGAVAGIECRIATAHVDREGVYGLDGS